MHEADHSLSSLRLEVSLCNDGASSVHIESGLMEDSRVTTLHLVALSLHSALRANNELF